MKTLLLIAATAALAGCAAYPAGSVYPDDPGYSGYSGYGYSNSTVIEVEQPVYLYGNSGYRHGRPYYRDGRPYYRDNDRGDRGDRRDRDRDDRYRRPPPGRTFDRDRDGVPDRLERGPQALPAPGRPPIGAVQTRPDRSRGESADPRPGRQIPGDRSIPTDRDDRPDGGMFGPNSNR